MAEWPLDVPRAPNAGRRKGVVLGMRSAFLVAVLLVVTLAFLTGCGGGPDNGAPPGGEQSIDLGTVQVGVASAAGFKTATLKTPAASRIAFTAMWGSEILRLQEYGFTRVAFVSTRTGGDEIWTQNIDGSDAVRLTQNGSVDAHPSWSPDGTQIAFHSFRMGNNEIHTMDADGTDVLRLTNNAASDRQPAWSPRGDKIAFVSDRASGNEIYVMDSDGGNQTRLTNSAGDDVQPAWSPDGRRIAFASMRDGNFEIYAMNADGTGQLRLTNNAGSDQEPAFSPDGRKIAFRSDRDGDNELYTMNVDGSTVTPFTDHAASDEHPVWSPNSESEHNLGQMVFRSTRHGGTDIFVLDLYTQAARNITNTGASESDPDWCRAPMLNRTLIGGAGTDGGQAPPFGNSRPLAVVAVRIDGLVAAATIRMAAVDYGSVDVEPLEGLGPLLAGIRIVGNNIKDVREDVGRGLSPRIFPLGGATQTNGVLVFFAGDTGRIASVIAVTDTPAGEPTAERVGNRLLLRGSFAEARDARDPGLNRVAGPASLVTLDARTGQVLSVAAAGEGGREREG